MSFFILPKTTNTINISPICSVNRCQPYLSYSFLTYYLDVKKQIIEMFTFDNDLSDNTFEEAIRIINPYEFIFSKVPGSRFSVSKLKPNSNLFYDLFEIFNNLNIFEDFKTHSIKSLHVSPNCDDTVHCYEMFREGFTDVVRTVDHIDINSNQYENDFEYIFFETNITNERQYFISLFEVLITIFRSQKNNGNIIIKIKDVLHKPVIDTIYMLTSLYEKVYIVKPNTNNISSLERYVVCKSFKYNEKSRTYLRLNSIKLIIFLKKLEDNHITGILDFDLSCYFKNKIDEINIIIGQQQIDALDQIIYIFKNKNKNDKIETIKKSNIQKSVSWCEKYKIPCNKFVEKINIFLPVMNETI